jgi:hypothetical protein
MKKTLLTLVAVLSFVVLGSTQSWALTINDPGVVGAVGGEALANADVTTERAAAQHLLDMLLGTSDPVGCSLANSCYQTSNTEYSGTLQGGTKSDPDLGLGDHAYQVPGGYQYAFAKYDGDNAGYVLFYLGGTATSLPQYSNSIWWNGTDVNSYQISHFTVFGTPEVPDPRSSVPDGGSTAALLGSALVGFGLMRRRFGRR